MSREVWDGFAEPVAHASKRRTASYFRRSGGTSHAGACDGPGPNGIFALGVLGTLMFCSVWLSPGTAHAYIGPGAGLSAIGSLLALIAAVLLAIVGFVWYPLKRIMKNRRKAHTETAQKDEAAPS